MTEPPIDPQAESDRGHESAGGGHPGLPRWVTMSAIVVALLVLALVVVMVIVGGDHGPGRHGG
jgi:hypothetical protein